MTEMKEKQMVSECAECGITFDLQKSGRKCRKCQEVFCEECEKALFNEGSAICSDCEVESFDSGYHRVPKASERIW